MRERLWRHWQRSGLFKEDEHLKMKLDLENNGDDGEEHGVGIADANEDEE
jgi:hypothetical protein